MDGIDQLSEKFQQLTATLDKLDAVQPQLVALHSAADCQSEANLQLALNNYAPIPASTRSSAHSPTTRPRWDGSLRRGQNDDFFYMPPEAFDNPDFKRE